MVIATETTQDLSYRARIEAIRKTKSAHTDEKIRIRGFMNIDDHGWIPWPDPIPFEPKSNHPSGGCYGPKCIGENFREWLKVHPVYIHPMSSLAGAWMQGGPPGVGGWRPEDRATHLEEVQKKYHFIMPGIGGMNHIGPDMRIGLDLGWGGLLDKIRHYRDYNRPQDTSFYDGEEAFVLGVQHWIKRHVVKAREMAAEEEDPILRDNFLEIAEMNEWLIDHPPRTLREACQFLAWFQSVDRMWGCGGALGQLDELLRPFYEADRANGMTDDEAVIWHIACLFFNDTHYSQIGGPAAGDGHDLTSPVSFLILEAMHRIRIPINMAVRVHDELNPDLLRKAVEDLFEDGTGCCYALSNGLDNGFARNGVPIQIARMRAKVGCNWTALPGIEYCLQDVTRICLIKPFQIAFNEVMEAAKTGSEPTLDALWERYTHHLSIVVDTLKEGKDWHMKYHSRNTTEIVLNLFMQGPIERGLDVAEGGVDIYNLTCDAYGLATTADSFAAIEQRVVNEQRLTWQELAGHLESNYEDAESVRLMLRNIPRYGSGGSLGDKWAKQIADMFSDLVRSTPTPDGYRILPGLFSHGDINTYGKVLDATPNGRRDGDPTSHSANPDPGFMPDGGGAPTAKSNAVAYVQPRWGNTTPLQMDLDSTLAEELGGIETVEALIKTHNELGGTMININVISKDQILEAHADPSKYPDLVVRVTGYSAYFKSLSPEYRQQIVDRLLSERNEWQ